MKDYNKKQHRPITVVFEEEFLFRPHLNEFKKVQHLSNGEIKETFYRKPKEDKIEDSHQQHLLRD